MFDWLERNPTAHRTQWRSGDWLYVGERELAPRAHPHTVAHAFAAASDLVGWPEALKHVLIVHVQDVGLLAGASNNHSWLPRRREPRHHAEMQRPPHPTHPTHPSASRHGAQRASPTVRCGGLSQRIHEAWVAARSALLAVWPLPEKEAGQEATYAIAYASRFHTAWLWSDVTG
jgi:hypothetical protein